MQHASTSRSLVRREVASYFLDNPLTWIHAGELGRALGRPSQVVGRHLVSLEDTKVLESRVVGRRREFRLAVDLKSSAARELRTQIGTVEPRPRSDSRLDDSGSNDTIVRSSPGAVEPSTRHPLHFEDLDPTAFEDLVRDLLSRQRGWRSLVAIGRVGADEGTDIEGVEWVGIPPGTSPESVPTNTPTHSWRIQVKRHRSLGPAALRRIVDAMAAPGTVPWHGLLVATSADLTPAARRTFIRAAHEAGVVEPELWTRSFLEDELRRPENAVLLRRFFGLGHGVEGTVAKPPALEASPGQSIPLLGRDDELRRLQHGSGDWIILGRPGVGKTRLAYEAGALRFVSHAADAEVSDSIRMRRPRRIVVDDAGLEPERLDMLLDLRRTGMAFDVIAIGWPEHQATIRQRLKEASEIKLDLLERPEMDEIVRLLGVDDYFLRGEILRQAEGRPGWAVAIAAAARNGDIESVVSGRGLMDQVEPILRRVSRDPEATLAVVGVLSALGPASADDFADIADFLRLSAPELQHALNDAATSGIIERNGDGPRERWEIRPNALRYSIVVRRFFDLSIPAVGIDAVVARWPERRSMVLRAVIRAAAAGSTGARQRIEAWLGANVADPSVLAEYAALDETAARRAVRLALKGSSTGAVEVLKAAAGRFALREAIVALLDIGAGDDRPMHSHPDHPIRVLGDLATRVFPNGRTSFALREPFLRVANVWLDDQPTPERQVAWARLVCRVLQPTAEGTWMQLGSSRTAQLMGGFESPENLRRVSGELWPQVATRLASLESIALVELIEVVDSWLRLARGMAGAFGVTPRQEHQTIAHDLSAAMLDAFSVCATNRPAVGLKLRRTARLIRARVRVALPAEFRMLTWDLWRSWKSVDRRAGPLLERMGEGWAAEPPQDVMARLVLWRSEAALAGGTLVPAVYFAMRGLAKHADDLDSYIEAAFEAGLCGEAQGLLQTALLSVSDVPDWLDRAITGPCRTAALLAAVAEGSPLPISRWAIQRLKEEDADLVDAVLRRPDGKSLAAALLEHPVPKVRGRTALEFQIGSLRHGVALDPNLYDAWANAFLDAIAPAPSDHAEFRVREILSELSREDPDLAERWLSRRLDDLGWDAFHFAIPYQADAIFRRLPVENRERLARRFADAPFKSALFPYLLAGDPGLLERLLADSILDVGDVLLAFSSIGDDFEERRDIVQALTPTLIENGATPESIAGTAYSGTWMGEESKRYSRLIELFTQMASNGNEAIASVGRAGVAVFEDERAGALLHERRERVVGLDR
jgi:DNA-binding transcriptional ArsR family regulator